MTKTAFTPGDWIVMHGPSVQIGTRYRVGTVIGGEMLGRADAHLIAAAPELYEALEYLAAESDPEMDDDYNPHAAPLAKAAAALAKARGEP